MRQALFLPPSQTPTTPYYSTLHLPEIDTCPFHKGDLAEAIRSQGSQYLALAAAFSPSRQIGVTYTKSFITSPYPLLRFQTQKAVQTSASYSSTSYHRHEAFSTRCLEAPTDSLAIPPSLLTAFRAQKWNDYRALSGIYLYVHFGVTPFRLGLNGGHTQCFRGRRVSYSSQIVLSFG